MIAIEGMTMPLTCVFCRLMADGWCYAADTEVLQPDIEDIEDGKRPSWCPLVDLSKYEDDLK